jgi:hypothetical protein
MIKLPEFDSSFVWATEQTILSLLESASVRIQNMLVGIVADKVLGVLPGGITRKRQLIH